MRSQGLEHLSRNLAPQSSGIGLGLNGGCQGLGDRLLDYAASPSWNRVDGSIGFEDQRQIPRRAPLILGVSSTQPGSVALKLNQHPILWQGCCGLLRADPRNLHLRKLTKQLLLEAIALLTQCRSLSRRQPHITETTVERSDLLSQVLSFF